ncbi:MAG TPA: hypothetical protein PKA76_06700 [Pirellulaceae bacterium]|nr:hypothetical protein [Pirellulaceae bacterium]
MGNPSDGYGGKTISLPLHNFWAEVSLHPSPNVFLEPGVEEAPRYDSVYQLIESIERTGYSGGLRLIRASVKRFVSFAENELAIACDRGFTISYQTNIPRCVGLAGSSALVVAALKVLAEYFNVEMAPPLLASLALTVERDELGIPAGLQDRVVQAFDRLVYMDFSRMTSMHGLEVGHYQELSQTVPGNPYVAICRRGAEPTELLHGSLQQRFRRGDVEVTQAMKRFAELAELGKVAIERGDAEQLNSLIDANFDLRQSICDINPLHLRMIELARSVGASAKFCGSGGAIIGLVDDDSMFVRLEQKLAQLDCFVVRPI